METITNFLQYKKIERLEFDCETHGSILGYKNALNGDGVCPLCIDKQNEEGRIKQENERAEHRLNASGIPKRYIDTKFDRQSEDQKNAVKCAWIWVNEARKCVWSHMHINGRTGVGKTLLACKAAIHLIQHGWHVKYTTSSNICDDVKSSYKKEYPDDVIHKLINQYDLLVLDELDTIINTDHDRSLIHKIIRGRYEQMMPMITISNNSTSTLKTIGERAVSALSENQTIVEITSEDQRVKVHTDKKKL